MQVANEHLKEALEQHRRVLLAELADIDSRVGLQMIGYKTHQADVATRAFDQAADLALRHNTVKILREVEDALARFERGTYGLCETCGDPIGTARLEAIPHAARCIRCAQAPPAASRRRR